MYFDRQGPAKSLFCYHLLDWGVLLSYFLSVLKGIFGLKKKWWEVRDGVTVVIGWYIQNNWVVLTCWR